MLQRAGVTPKPERIQVVSEFFQSGKTMAAWSKERQINRYTLHNWVEEYRQETKLAQRSGEWFINEFLIPLPVFVNTGDNNKNTLWMANCSFQRYSKIN